MPNKNDTPKSLRVVSSRESQSVVLSLFSLTLNDPSNSPHSSNLRKGRCCSKVCYLTKLQASHLLSIQIFLTPHNGSRRQGQVTSLVCFSPQCLLFTKTSDSACSGARLWAPPLSCCSSQVRCIQYTLT